MAKRVKDLAVVVGTYEANGDEKRRYMNCGCVMENDDGGQFLMLNRFINYALLPRKQGSDAILVSIFDLKGREDGGGNSPAKSFDNDLDDDMPF